MNIKLKEKINTEKAVHKILKRIHEPVLLHESIEVLHLNAGDTVVDCTVNRGGHAEIIAEKIGNKGTLIIFDLDKTALTEAENKLNKIKNGPKVIPFHSNYRFLKSKIESAGIKEVDAIFADLGLSSEELEISGRGFTFQKDEPLYMTFQSDVDANTLTAKDLLNTLSAKDLSNILKNYGDETRARKIAEKIVEHREENGNFETTFDLLKVVESVVPNKSWLKTHPATKTFQALRIAVNDEYDGVRELVNDGFQILKQGGRFGIITFHSGEDRIVKKLFNNFKTKKLAKVRTKLKPKSEEIRNNRRSRSALLRHLTKN